MEEYTQTSVVRNIETVGAHQPKQSTAIWLCSYAGFLLQKTSGDREQMKRQWLKGGFC